MRKKQQLTEIMRFSMNVVTFGWGSTDADEREKMLRDYCKEKGVTKGYMPDSLSSHGRKVERSVE